MPLFRLALFAPVLSLAVAASLAAQRVAPVVMISIDGMRPDSVIQAEAHGLKVPNLRLFVTGGSYAEGVTGVVPTLTYPSHTTLVTGVSPAVHGILSNTTFDPLFRNQIGWYWYAEQEHAETLWQAAHRKGVVTASVNWPVTVDAAGVDFNLPEFWRASTSDDLPLLDALARPLGLQRELAATAGPWIDGNTTTISADETRTQFAVALLKQKHPGLLTVHLSSLDEAEHETAPFSSESNRVLEALDGMIGQIRDAALAEDARSVLVIVSDHGFIRTDYHVNLYIPLIKAGLLSEGQGGAPKFSAWKATLWPAGGSAAVMLHDANDAASRDTILHLLKDLAADPANGIDRIVSREELTRLGGFPDAQALVVLKPDYQLGYTFSGPLITPAPSTGMHGYLPSDPEMRSSFFIMGKGVSPGRDLGLIDMRAIAPTLARLLGCSLVSAQQPALRVH